MLRFFNLQSIRTANCPQTQFDVHQRTLRLPSLNFSRSGVVGAPAFMRGKERFSAPERVSTLITRFPGFPVQLVGSALLAAFLNESRIRGPVQRSVQEIRV
jgi:hypothetical protein